MTILLAILIFGILIFIHELGHFIVARLCGVTILEFAIGMGPRLFSHVSKKSGIRYSIRMFPIGGFVSMMGENGMEAVQGSNGMPADDNPLINEVPDIDLPEEETAQPDLSGNRDDRSTASADKTAADSQCNDPHAYCNQSVWKRILISIAGPLMNVVLGFLLMLVMVLSAGQQQLGTNQVAGFHVQYNADEEYCGLKKGDYLYSVNGARVFSFEQFRQTVSEDEDHLLNLQVRRLNEDGTDVLTVDLSEIYLDGGQLGRFSSSLSEQSGLRINDEIIKVNKTSVHTYNELSYEIINQGHSPLCLTVLRDGEKIVLDQVIFPNFTDNGAVFGDVDFLVWGEPDADIGTVLKHTWFRSLSTVKMVFDSIFGLASGRYGIEAVSGPVGVTKTIATVAKTGLLNVLYLVVVISINLGIMNLLPLPALDGGHILLYLIEVIRRKPMKKEVEGAINLIGMLALLALAVIITIKDVITL